MVFLVELWVELRRGLRSYISYPLQALGEIIALMLAFAFINNSQSEGSGAGTAVGFAVVFIAFVGLQAANKVVKDESDAGTLEQLYLACSSLPRVIFLRTLADTLRLIPILFGMLAVTVNSIGTSFASWVGPVILLSLVMNTGMLGIGLIIGAIALLFKRVGFLANLASISLLPLALTPVDKFPGGPAGDLLKAIPFTLALNIFRDLLIEFEGVRSTLISSSMAFLLVNSVVSFLVGMVAFRVAERIARDRGLIGKY
ncbi:MAG TPA: ABC transporter permease [Firmicutes bacterium]|nr:ABC transporter permease [Bacillota bacterium]